MTEWQGIGYGVVIAVSIFLITLLFPNFSITESVTLGDLSGMLIIVFASIAVITYFVSKKIGHAVFHTTENGILGGLAGAYFLLDTFGVVVIQTAAAYAQNINLGLDL